MPFLPRWIGKPSHAERHVLLVSLGDGMSLQPPPAGFDVLQGSGSGVCNGKAATANFRFADHGEPGTDDTATIQITGSGGCSLSVSGNLQSGNLQAQQ